MNLVVKKMDRIAVCAFNGKFDTNAAPEMEKKLLQVLREGNQFLVFDFAGLAYLTSAGIRILLMMHRAVKQAQGRIIYANVPVIVQDIFDLVGLWSQLEVQPSVSEATAAILARAN